MSRKIRLSIEGSTLVRILKGHPVTPFFLFWNKTTNLSGLWTFRTDFNSEESLNRGTLLQPLYIVAFPNILTQKVNSDELGKAAAFRGSCNWSENIIHDHNDYFKINQQSTPSPDSHRTNRYHMIARNCFFSLGKPAFAGRKCWMNRQGLERLSTDFMACWP
jgi:hypothetical protein